MGGRGEVVIEVVKHVGHEVDRVFLVSLLKEAGVVYWANPRRKRLGYVKTEFRQQFRTGILVVLC